MVTFDINDYQKFRELMSASRKQYGPLNRTNLYYMGDTLKNWVEGGLKYFITDGGICFLKQEGNRNRLYYALNKRVKSIKVQHPNLITEFICRSEDEKKENEAFMHESGFRRKAIYNEMIKMAASSEPNPNGKHRLTFAEHGDCANLLSHWKMNLDDKEHPLPEPEALKKMITDKQVPVIKNEDNKIIAAMMIHIENKIGYIELVAVDKSFRGKGFGRKLIENIDEITCVNKWFLFVNESNTVAQRLYIKCGFTYSGRQLFQYYK